MASFSFNLTTAVLACLSLLLVNVLPCPALAAEAIRFLETMQSQDSIALSRPSADTETYIRRKGEVVLTAKDLFVPRTVSGREEPLSTPESIRQQELQLSFFPGQDIRIVVDSESESPSGILSYTGRRSSATLSTFSMTITSDSYLITFQDMDSGMTYKVVGDMNTGTGRVTEYDMAKLPPVFDEPPIIPPQE